MHAVQYKPAAERVRGAQVAAGYSRISAAERVRGAQVAAGCSRISAAERVRGAQVAAGCSRISAAERVRGAQVAAGCSRISAAEPAAAVTQCASQPHRGELCTQVRGCKPHTPYTSWLQTWPCQHRQPTRPSPTASWQPKHKRAAASCLTEVFFVFCISFDFLVAFAGLFLFFAALCQP
jgi:hypothetical protein